jgi:AcrR family transcriptional regulator
MTNDYSTTRLTMPRPRFQKLSPEKRESILQAAAQEFAVCGYEAASLNRILEQAELSKGAAYYYFDDKADLFTSTVQHYWHELVGELDLTAEGLTAVTFWPALEHVYRQQFVHYAARPWVLGVIKAAGNAPPELLAQPPLAALYQQLLLLLAGTLQKGRELGVIRDDLPEDLLMTLVMGLDTAADQWLLQQWPTLTPAAREEVVGQVFGVLRQVLQGRKNGEW